jgi:hypothetical protein
LENYIPVSGSILPLKVILKTDWLKLKEEMKAIKCQLAALNPEIMYQPNQQTVRRYSEISGDHSVKSKAKRFGFESENGSIVRIKNLSQAASANVTKH